MKARKKTKKAATSVFLKSEFWMSAATCISGLLMAFGVITPVQSNTIAAVAPQLIGAILALFSSSKFVSTQHAAKVEVFRAMCETQSRDDGTVKALGYNSAEDRISDIAHAAGL